MKLILDNLLLVNVILVLNSQFNTNLGMTGIDRKDYRSVSMSEHDDSLRYQMMIKQQMAIITSH